jgi:hypothetical protein
MLVTIVDTYTEEKIYVEPVQSDTVLFNRPRRIQKITKSKKSDASNFIITLYTDTFQISTDKYDFYIDKDGFKKEKEIFYIDDNILKLNLYNRTFIKGTIKIKTESDILNKIIPLSPNENTVAPFDEGRLDNLEQVNNNELENIVLECESQLKQRNIEYENIKNKLIEDKKYYDGVLKRKDKDCESKITNCNNDLNYCTEARNNNSIQIDELELENNQLKLENDELKKQKNKNCNNSQSTQNTLVIIGLLIIVVLLGCGIYLYFKKQ